MHDDNEHMHSDESSLSLVGDYLKTEEIRETLHKTEMPNLKQRSAGEDSSSMEKHMHYPSPANSSQEDPEEQFVEVEIDPGELERVELEMCASEAIE